MAHLRSKIQQKIAILETIKRYPNFPQSRIIVIAGVMYRIGSKYFDWFLQNEFIKSDDPGFICTQKACKTMQDWTNLCNIMGEESECLI
jgi:predicted transcriptional regulator